jgi:GNAT superfamily N-acetyltransferase
MEFLGDGYHAVSDDRLATVVISLEMLSRPELRPLPTHPAWTCENIGADVARYRELFRRVGEEYLWASRLLLTDDALHEILSDRRVHVEALRHDGRDEGILELDFRQPHECELTFFGLAPALVGHGAGRWLMNRAIETAWSQPITRFWVHTCDLDHPAARTFYERSGFRAFARQVEVFEDPRVSGILPAHAAPHVPRFPSPV